MRIVVLSGLFFLLVASSSSFGQEFSPRLDHRAESRVAEMSASRRGEIESVVRDYLVRNPEVIAEAMQALQRRYADEAEASRRETISRNADELFRSRLDYSSSSDSDRIPVVEFVDYNCGYCRRSLEAVTRLMSERDDVRLIVKEFPILSDESRQAARLVLASRRQGKYWEMHSALLSFKGVADEKTALAAARSLGLDTRRLVDDSRASEIDDALDRARGLAEALGIRGTPAFVIGDEALDGAVGYDRLRAQVDKVRREGCDVC